MVAALLLVASVVAGVQWFRHPQLQDGVNWTRAAPPADEQPRSRVTNLLLRFADGAWSLDESETVAVAPAYNAGWTLQRPLGPSALDRRIMGLWPVGATYPRWSGPSATLRSEYEFVGDEAVDLAHISARPTWYARVSDWPTQRTLLPGRFATLNAPSLWLPYAQPANSQHRAVLQVVSMDSATADEITSLEDVRTRMALLAGEMARSAELYTGDRHGWLHLYEERLVDAFGLTLVLNLRRDSLRPVRDRLAEWVSAPDTDIRDGHASLDRVLAWGRLLGPAQPTDDEVATALEELSSWAGDRAVRWVVSSNEHALRDHPAVVRRRAQLSAPHSRPQRAIALVNTFMVSILVAAGAGVWWVLRRGGFRLAAGPDGERRLQLSLLVALILASVHRPAWARIDLGNVGLLLAALSCWSLASSRRARWAGVAFVTAALLQPMSEWFGSAALDALSRAAAFAGLALVVVARRATTAVDETLPPRRAAPATRRTALQHVAVVGVAVLLIHYAFGFDYTGLVRPEPEALGRAAWLVLALLAGAVLVVPRRSPRDSVLRVPLAAYALAVGASAHIVTCLLAATGSRIDAWDSPSAIGALAAVVLLGGVAIRILFRARLHGRAT